MASTTCRATRPHLSAPRAANASTPYAPARDIISVANNRYFLLCPCGGTQYIGKSLGRGIYHTRDSSHEFLEEVYEWMWDHFMENHAGLEVNEAGKEWVAGEIFKVITEYDDRVKSIA